MTKFNISNVIIFYRLKDWAVQSRVSGTEVSDVNMANIQHIVVKGETVEGITEEKHTVKQLNTLSKCSVSKITYNIYKPVNKLSNFPFSPFYYTNYRSATYLPVTNDFLLFVARVRDVYNTDFITKAQ